MIAIDKPSEVDVLSQVCSEICAGVRTALPGVVLSYDAATRTARVQPSRRGRVPGARGDSYDLPPTTPCPVLWPRFAGVVIVGRLNPGDTVLLLVSDRELDQWLASPTGAPYDPKSPRMHDLTDAMVLPALSPTAKPITVGNGGSDLYIGRENGLASIAVGIDAPRVVVTSTGPASLQLGSAAAANPVVLGTPLFGAFTAFTALLTTAAATWNFATGGVPAAATPAVNGVYVATLIAANAALATTLATWLSTKVLTE